MRRLDARGALFVLLALASAGTARAQETRIRGRVLDGATAEGIPSASVALWRISRDADTTLATGAIADADGRFEILGARRGSYVVRASAAGFETFETRAFRLTRGALVQELGALRLEPLSLGEVEVVAARPRIQVGIDRTVYDLADDPVAQGGSATDALRAVPSVEVDVDGNVSLRGSSVTILIDGRPAPVSGDFVAVYLQSLPASAIARVEVIPNPSAAFQAEGAGGMVNIVLKEDRALGLGATVTAGGDSQGGGQASALVALGRGPLSLTGTLGLRQSRRDADATRLRTLFEPGTTLDQASDGDRRRRSLFSGLSAEWRAGPTTWGANAQLGLRGGDEDELTTFLDTDGTGATLADYTRTLDGSSSATSGDLRLTLRHDFAGVSQDRARESGRGRGRGGRGGGRGGRGGGGGASASLGEHGLAFELRGSLGTDDDRELVLQSDTDRRDLVGTDGDEVSLRASVDYARPLGGVRLETGLRSEVERRETYQSTTFSLTAEGGVPVVGDGERRFRLDEDVHAGYVQLQGERGPLGLQAGLRAEAARQDASFDGAAEAPGFDLRLFPSASARLAVSDALSLRLGYSRRVRRPRGRQLDPFPDPLDVLNLRVGNPGLGPELTDSGELAAIWLAPWGTLTATPYLRRTTDVIRSVTTLRDDGVTVSTYANLATSTSGGVEVVASAAVGRVRGFASVEGYRQTVDDDGATELQSDAFGWGGRVNGSWDAGAPLRWGRLDLQATAFFRAPQQSEQGRRSGILVTDFALRQALGDRASLTLRTSDPFGLARIEGTTETELFRSEYARAFGRQQVALTLQMTFGERDESQRQRGRGEAGAGGGGEDFEDEL